MSGICRKGELGILTSPPYWLLLSHLFVGNFITDTGMQMSVRYSGAWPCRQLYITAPSLYWTLSGISRRAVLLVIYILWFGWNDAVTLRRRVPPVIGPWGHHHHRLFSAVREHEKGFKPTHGYWQRQTFNYGPKSSQFLNAYHQNIKRLWLAVCSVPRKTLADIRRKFCHALKWRLSFTVNTKICYVNCEKNALNFEW